MIVGWLRMLFGNVVSLYGTFKKLESVDCIEEELHDMILHQREEDRDSTAKAAEDFKKTRAAQVAKEQAATRESQGRAGGGKLGGTVGGATRPGGKHDQRQQDRESVKAAGRGDYGGSDINAAGGGGGAIALTGTPGTGSHGALSGLGGSSGNGNGGGGEADQVQLNALANEEAELRRKIASGEMSVEEVAAAEARLGTIASERAAIVAKEAKLQEMARQEALSEVTNALTALEDEETTLLRRLASGELSEREERAIRARLSAIDGERSALQVR